jgi:hypothetical protein
LRFTYFTPSTGSFKKWKSGIFYAKSYAFATQNVPFEHSKRMLSRHKKCLLCIIITPKRKQMLTKQHPTPYPFNLH